MHWLGRTTFAGFGAAVGLFFVLLLHEMFDLSKTCNLEGTFCEFETNLLLVAAGVALFAMLAWWLGGLRRPHGKTFVIARIGVVTLATTVGLVLGWLVPYLTDLEKPCGPIGCRQTGNEATIAVGAVVMAAFGWWLTTRLWNRRGFRAR